VARDHSREAAAPCDLLEVGELRLHRYGPAEGLRLLAPRPDVVSHGLNTGLDFGGRGQVALEGGLGAGGFARTIGDDGPVVLAVRDAEIPGGGFAEMLLQKGERLRSEIRARLYPEPLHPCRGDGSDPVKFGDRQGCEELVVGDARRGRQANVLEDAGANLLGGRRGGREAAPVLRDIEIGLIERQRLDQRIAVVDGMAERTPKARAS
jgi:hypothetical protein